eukprot:GHVT01002120.1.p1 GENE.GHVT01002120.1~~GHVT01002120.1.p1  ORF type:complete len:116 (-),score=25.67 GHVT01002120.1:1724-2071(-)
MNLRDLRDRRQAKLPPEVAQLLEDFKVKLKKEQQIGSSSAAPWSSFGASEARPVAGDEKPGRWSAAGPPGSSQAEPTKCVSQIPRSLSVTNVALSFLFSVSSLLSPSLACFVDMV